MPNRAPIPHGKKKASQVRDPSISKSMPITQLAPETEAALKRSKQKGVLVAASALPDKIYEIRIHGAEKVDPEAIIPLLETEINQPLNEEKIAQDIRQIFKLGLFTDVQVKKEQGPNQSIILTYELTEKATIFKIKFDGNEEISTEDLTEAIDLKAYQIASMHRIRDNAEKIRRHYAEKGFLLTHVAYEVKPTKASDIEESDKLKAPDFVDVIFHIEEESKIKVEHITILGNKAISTNEIKSRMQTKEKHPLSFIMQWGFFNEDMLEIDGLLIEQLYQENGFLNVQVSKPRATLSPDKKQISVYISITEGSAFKLGNVSFSGDLLNYSEDSLQDKITLKTGEIFNKSEFGRNLSAIQEVYQDEGYAYVNVIPNTQIEEEERRIDIELEVIPGPLVRFGRFDITGNITTIDEVIRRELRVYEGELYSGSMLRLSEQRLNQLGYFESVQLKTKPGDNPDVLDIEVEVKEKKLGQIQVGGGYGTGGEGFLFQAQISQNNLFGRGQSISGTVLWSAYRRIFELQFTDPYLTYLGPAPLSFSIRAYDTQRSFVDYSRGSSGGEIMFGYPVGFFLRDVSAKWYKNAPRGLEPYVPDFENLRFFLSYMAERVQIEDSLAGVNYWGWHLNQPRYTTSLKPSLQFDQRNNRIFPTAGYFFEVRSEFASSYFGSVLLADLENKIRDNSKPRGIDSGLNFLRQDAEANNLIRWGINTRFYYNFDSWFPLKNWVLKLNVDFGFLDTFGIALVSENFRLGGVQLGAPTGLRGYFFQSIGPSINVGQQNSTEPIRNLVIGGNKQFLTNLELEFPLIRSINLFGVGFFDMGNVYAPDEGLFYVGTGDFKERYKGYYDPLGLFYGLGLYSAVGFGLRWFSPMGALRFEWGFPLVRRPHGTPSMPAGDSSMQFL
ncbi:MAG: outer membrane protein assembly factor BamA, partial [Deltaproteobacteria bacterium]|nr:outer membrane protein assembly factor BamA [Deltaproteobacteria bacterium]